MIPVPPVKGCVHEILTLSSKFVVVGAIVLPGRTNAIWVCIGLTGLQP